MTMLDDTIVFDATEQANAGSPPSVNGHGSSKDADPDAPYGRKADGTPRGKPGPKKGTNPPPRVSTSIPKPQRAAGARQKTTPRGGTDYTQGILGILQLPAFALGAAGQFNEALALDGAAIAIHAPGIATALNDLANDNPSIAGALDRILTAGPYGAILGACIPLAMQIAANHRKIPDAMARGAGALPVDEFREMLNVQRSQQG